MEQEKLIRQFDDQLYKLDRELNRIKDDIAGLQDTQQLITTKLSSILVDSAKLHNLFKVVVEGDVEPSLKTQATLLQRDFQSLKEIIKDLPSRLDFSELNQQITKLEDQLENIKSQAEKVKEIKEKLSLKTIETLLVLVLTAGITWFGPLIYKQFIKDHPPKPASHIDNSIGNIVMQNEYDFLDKR